MMDRAADDNFDGFFLLECLVALVIIGGALTWFGKVVHGIAQQTVQVEQAALQHRSLLTAAAIAMEYPPTVIEPPYVEIPVTIACGSDEYGEQCQLQISHLPFNRHPFGEIHWGPLLRRKSEP